ncbi:hypothetical protein BCU84_17340 [Shewanella sp. 10N.286.51.B7]|uniref:DUF1488 domain-containing protein n=1 Tax=Shewanella electrodiphila TaxID=934143 RepID=A0ABT0KV54_9GAMM|nr:MULTISPECIES: DUF1488 domain-containing protein [Shewanella]MCC4834028.1 DUF1488 domain-containing protein [Shewanella sp. 10N.7]MCL1047728.1 DUF1488 domain-containing protein [Shewanella electrodiphila]PMG74851.1 hypothetical protein BCU84_17340 [Shewanella sp. 10N.286.51.B7]
MNQSIIFTDIVEWDEALKQVYLIVQVQGVNVSCFIKPAIIEKLTSTTIKNGTEAIVAFEQVRFDIEDLAEALIESESFDEHGHIYIE